MQKAFFQDKERKADTVAGNRRNDNFLMQISAIVTGKAEPFANAAYNQGREVVCIRVYGTRAANYVCVWVHDNKTGTHRSAGARATGGGYHRPSAALQEALHRAGVDLSQGIDGRGNSAMTEAAAAIMAALGYKKTQFFIHTAEG